ncbi:hypothetical protein PRUB_a2978 [Pseudoalteromonas rubra]|uniref:Uncharacterized protein n=1 Tax=Pseudoalteromonas rubra TaxID=43658 RepID=A0A8T0CCB2_9GAMM|nr:hypothetical protein [Pseudoalteromonas rubra]KAF7788343.1 hypothetical protein PRUB_a2978 [Pseudoalteromonas rubra]
MMLDFFIFLYLLICTTLWFVDVTRFHFIQRSFEGIQIAGILISVSFSGIYFFSGQFVKLILILPFSIYLQSKFKKFKQVS